MPDERETRIQRVHDLREQGINPYPNTAERTHTIAEVLEHFDEFQQKGTDGSFTLVGRIRLIRRGGKITFMMFEDVTARIQLYLTINDLNEESYK